MKIKTIVLTADEVCELLKAGKVLVKREIVGAPALSDPNLIFGHYEKKGGRKVYGLSCGTRRWPCPFLSPGSKLTVKEEWNFARGENGELMIIYKADDAGATASWRSPNTMPDDYCKRAVISMNGGVEQDGKKVYWWAELHQTFFA